MVLHIGLVGTGSFSRMHAAVLAEMEEVKIRAICGTSLEKAEEMAAGFSGATGYSRLEDMLDREQLDAVYICVPPMAHGGIENMLIERHIPFFVEKPLAADKKTADSIMAHLNGSSLITSAGYHFRYKPSVRKLKENLQTAVLGFVSGQWMGDMPQVAWWRKQEGSGGQFIEQTTHIVDLLRYIAGEVEEVYALYGDRVNQSKFAGVTVPDVGTVSLKLKSGAVASIANTCLLPTGISQVGLSFYTDQGMMAWQPDKLTITAPDGTVSEKDEAENPYRKESEAFLYAVRTGDRSRILSDYRDAYETHLVTCAALESSRKGVPVKVNS